MESEYTVRTSLLIKEAKQIALMMQHAEVTEIHLLKALLSNQSPNVTTIFDNYFIDSIELEARTDQLLERLAKQAGLKNLYVSRAFQTCLLYAAEISRSLYQPLIASTHLLLALLSLEKSPVSYHLEKAGLDKNDLRIFLEEHNDRDRLSEKYPNGITQVLLQYGRDLTKEAREGQLDPVIGMDDAINRLIQMLSRRQKNNPLIIGQPGVGKSALVEGFAQRIANQDVPENLLNRIIYSLKISDVLAGAKLRGEFEERLQEILSIIVDSNRQIILFIDEIHTIMGSGASGGGIDAANMLKPMLARGQITLIGATTLEEYSRYIKNDRALDRRFQTLQVDEPNQEMTVSILRGLKTKLENFHGISIDDDALIEAVTLSTRYISQRRQPDKALDVMDEACAMVKTQQSILPVSIDKIRRQLLQLQYEKIGLSPDQPEKIDQLDGKIGTLQIQLDEAKVIWKKERARHKEINRLKTELDRTMDRLQKLEHQDQFIEANTIRQSALIEISEKIDSLKAIPMDYYFTQNVSIHHIKQVISKMSGIPLSSLNKDEQAKILGMETWLNQRLKGQDSLIHTLCRHFTKSIAGLNDPSRPLGSFLFTGPTGVGKTYLAKLLATYLFLVPESFIRLDMSEYMDKNAVSKLIGAPPGYIGYEEGGRLTEAVMHRPFSIILFDEIEKANAQILNILLQVLDEGTLTDAKGRKVDFTNTVIILTSNVFPEPMQSGTYPFVEGARQALSQSFKPELLNRLDEVMVFSPLDQSAIREIIKLHLDDLAKRLPDGIELKFNPELVDWIVEKVDSQTFGAREVKRFVHDTIASDLSLYLLENNPSKPSVLYLTVNDNFTLCISEKRKEQ